MVARMVTIEGTWTPAVGGPGRGERWEVEFDVRVRNLLRAGAARVVAERVSAEADTQHPEHIHAVLEPDDPDDVELETSTAAAPAHNASRARWADYLRSKGIAFPDDREAFDAGDKTAWASRDDLIIIDQQASGGS
ncbi:hypothetical protein B1R94_02340 [Mycolicibacterium litorale]|nr:hypothetical protein B1R94_02340 [Mycolicibacterium litorale]